MKIHWGNYSIEWRPGVGFEVMEGEAHRGIRQSMERAVAFIQWMES